MSFFDLCHLRDKKDISREIGCYSLLMCYDECIFKDVNILFCKVRGGGYAYGEDADNR